jgi:capsular exopolysaccharide synthesis family protein
LEKIGIALARHLRTQPVDDHSIPPLRLDARAREVREVRVPGQIQYTRTRRVQIAPAVLERHRIAAIANDDTADTFRLLRTQVLMQMRQKGWQTLAITSPNKGAGKSTLAMNIALSFAMEVDHTALLVDADLRDPDVGTMLELPASPGLADYLVGSAAIEDLLIHPGIGNLVILPGGSPVANTSELLRSPMMSDLVAELRGRYADRLIVFDVPPILAGADTLALSAHVDATILLAEEGRTTPEDFSRARELLAGCTVMGVVLNKSRNAVSPDAPRRSWTSRLRAALRGTD